MPAELDAACATDSVLYISVSDKWVLHTKCFEAQRLLDLKNQLEDSEALRDDIGNPLLMLSIAVTRKTREGNVPGPTQALSRIDALRTGTQWPAYLSFDESNLSQLQVGTLADFVVVNRDYLACANDELVKLAVERTVVGGRTVFRKQPDGRACPSYFANPRFWRAVTME